MSKPAPLSRTKNRRRRRCALGADVDRVRALARELPRVAEQVLEHRAQQARDRPGASGPLATAIVTRSSRACAVPRATLARQSARGRQRSRRNSPRATRAELQQVVDQRVHALGADHADRPGSAGLARQRVAVVLDRAGRSRRWRAAARAGRARPRREGLQLAVAVGTAARCSSVSFRRRISSWARRCSVTSSRRARQYCGLPLRSRIREAIKLPHSSVPSRRTYRITPRMSGPPPCRAAPRAARNDSTSSGWDTVS